MDRIERCTMSWGLLGVLALGLTSPAAEAQTWPEKPVQWIVPYAAGAATDLLSRSLADAMSPLLGQPIVVVNRDGASATLGNVVVAQAKPDGYTLSATAIGPITIQPHLMKDLAYRVDSFTPICQTADLIFGMGVKPESPYRNVADLIAAAKAGKRVNYGVTGTNTVPHLNVIEFRLKAGIDLQHAAYRGDAPVIQAMHAGEIDVAIVGIGTLIAQNFRVLGIFAEGRVDDAPNLATFAEQGFAVHQTVPVGLLGPKGLPADIVQRLERACADAVKNPRYVELAKTTRQTLIYRNGAEFAKVIAADFALKGELIRQGGKTE